jgi:vesicle transport through interaction with t-SNAREs 1
LAQIRSHLASGQRNRPILLDCERLISDAKRCATAMVGLAEVEGDVLRLHEAQQRLERDVSPLQKEILRALQDSDRDELLHHTNSMEQGYRSDMDALIQSSDDLLRESQAILAETEQIGMSTIQQMGYQREQLIQAGGNAAVVVAVAQRAGTILSSMSRRALTNKYSLYVIIFLLIVANSYVIHRIYTKNYHAPN